MSRGPGRKQEKSIMESETLQVGTHPLFTPPPLGCPAITIRVTAFEQWFQ